MTDQLHIDQQSDDEEEDLELLRLEALKTINNKKEIIPQIPSYHHSPVHLRTISNPYKITQPHVTSVNTFPPKGTLPNDNINQNVYYPPVPQSDHNLPTTVRPLANHLNSYDARQRLEKLDINEPYVPQLVPPINPNIVGPPPPITVVDNWIAAESTGIMGNGYVPYVPHKVTENLIGVGNVQLSPRSMAFVAENNDILMRRKGEKSNYESGYNRSPRASPSYRSFSPAYRSPSPTYRSSPGRWSHSPSFKSKSRSPIPRNRQHPTYVHRRSASRSPHSGPRSPAFRRKTTSKSPPRMTRHPSPPSSYHRYQSKSPPTNNRRGKSRSPLVNPRHKLSPRRTSRSPNPSGRYERRQTSRSPPPNVNGRRKSPQGLPRYTNRSRGNSPLHSKRSPVYSRTSDSEHATTKHISRRSRSPAGGQSANNHTHRKSLSPRQRSRTRSPVRKYQRRSKERNPQFNRRRSPYDRNARKRNDGGSMNGFRNRNRKRSCSPMNSRRKRSRTKTPERLRRDDNRSRKFDRDRRRPEDYNGRDEKGRNSDDKYKTNQINVTKKDEEGGIDRKIDNRDSKERKFEGQDDKTFGKVDKEDKIQKVETKSRKDDTIVDTCMSPIKETDVEQDDKIDTIDKDEKNKNESQLKTTASNNDDDKENSENDEEDSSNEDDDGIDLFASDESESENEGRFKLSSSRNERDTQVPTLSFSKLGETSVPAIVKDLQEITSTSRSGSVKSDRGRNSGGGRSSDFDSRRRDDRFKKSSDGRRSSDRRRNNRDRRERDESTFKMEKRIGENKPMFKSTFTVVENEAVKSNSKFSLDRELNDKKSTLQLKKKSQTKTDKDSTEIEVSTSPSNKLASTVNTTTSSALASATAATSSSSSSSSGKKPIHLRLGAMTNTFKTPKKSNWTSSSLSSSPPTSSEKV